MVGLRFLISIFLGSVITAAVQADAQGLGRDTQTSSSWQIGATKKNATGKHCDVAIPASCKVGTNVPTKTHCVDLAKSGGMSRRFAPKRRHWKPGPGRS